MHILTIEAAGADPHAPAPGAPLATYLRHHGIAANVETRTRDGNSTAGAIAAYGSQIGANLLVMGGYGHSRLREFLLGGTTRSMLRDFDLPVLMVH